MSSASAVMEVNPWNRNSAPASVAISRNAWTFVMSMLQSETPGIGLHRIA